MSKRFDDSKEIWLNPDDSTLPAAKKTGPELLTHPVKRA
jgi:hypothetical protein